VKRAGSSGFLGARGENHRGGETVDAQSRDVDLITAVSGKLKRDTERQVLKVFFLPFCFCRVHKNKFRTLKDL